jgi:hypothetical protein
MKNSITENLVNMAPADLTAAEGGITTTENKIAGSISQIQPAQQKNYQKVGPKLLEIVRQGKNIAHDYSTSLPSGFSFDRIDNSLQNVDDFTHLKSLMSPVFATIKETVDVNAIVAADEMNKIYGYLQVAAESNAALKTVLEPIAKYYAKGPKKGYTVLEINADSIIHIKGAVPGTRVTNHGTTRICLSDEIENVGSVKVMGTVYVDPGGSALIPKGITSFQVKNMSATEKGSFSVKFRK